MIYYYMSLKKYSLFLLFSLVLLSILKVVFAEYQEAINSATLVLIGLFTGLVLSEFKNDKKINS